MGLSHRTDAGGNLIVDLPKNRCSHNAILVLSGHMDVVPPCNNIQPVVEGSGEDRVVYSDNTTVLGADDKAGLAVILEVVRHFMEHDLPRPTLRFLFTTREETMLGGAKDLSDADLKANFAVTLDHTGKQGTIIHQAPSYIEFTVECRGKSVHAGIMPERGVNAIVYASRVIERLHLGRIDGWTTANIGFIDGGKATNVVPDQVRFQGELRGHQPETLEKELAYIKQILEDEKANYPGTDYTFTYKEDFRAYQMDPHHPGVQLVMAAAREAGLEPELITTNGGSDNNVFYHRGLPGVVLSAGYVEPHSLKERVQVKEMRLCAEFLTRIVEQFAAHDF
jgi:tripeptide aminopeptidase